MKAEQLDIPGTVLCTPTVFRDGRGAFLEWFRQEPLQEATGHGLSLAQANWSTSRRGVVRGVHFADVPPGQAKHVTCVLGAVLDVVVDLRVGSPTFGRHVAVELHADKPQALYLTEGLGHAFCALSDDATVLYLCSSAYNPAAEHGVHPLDPELGLPWPDDIEPVLSPKDAAAPSLAEALAHGLLPTLDSCSSWEQRLRERAPGAGAS